MWLKIMRVRSGKKQFLSTVSDNCAVPPKRGGGGKGGGHATVVDAAAAAVAVVGCAAKCECA